MAFTRPTLKELKARNETSLSSRLIGAAKALRRSVIVAIAVTVAGMAHMLFGYLNYIFDNIFWDKSDKDFLPRQASVFGVFKNAATFTQLEIEYAGTNGKIIPVATILQRVDGTQYAVDQDAEVASGIATVTATALNAGIAAGVDVGETISLVTPIAGVTSAGEVTQVLEEGADEEDVESLRARFLERVREPPSGGTASDYKQWAMQVSGVTRVWVYPSQYGTGTVGISFVRDNDVSIIPDAGEVAAVQAYINTKRPITADVTVWAPVATPLDLTIALSPDTPALRAKILAELDDFFARDTIEPGSTVYPSQLSEVVSTVAGEEHHTLSVPATPQTATAGHIFTRGTVTWV